MRMRLLLAAAMCAPLSGCFVFIPGSVVSKISDGITGDKGEHCVSRASKVGDTIRLYDGRLFRVESLSGTSSRCTDSALPIRAELAFLGNQPAEIAKLTEPLPSAPAPKPVTEADKAAACAKMAAVKPGAPQAEFQAAWEGLNKVGMTWRDCK